jgi:hypothetical protein
MEKFPIHFCLGYLFNAKFQSKSTFIKKEGIWKRKIGV